MLKVLRPGMLSTVQDLGRWGYQQFGMPVSGAMDACSHRLANRLVGNPDSEATLEITLIGPRLEFLDPTEFAVTGAEFRLSLNDRLVQMNQAVKVASGDVLSFGERSRGARGYLAVTGGIRVPPVLGSRSTHTLSGTGGFQGRALRTGDELPTIGSSSASGQGVARPEPALLPLGGARVRFVGEDPNLATFLSGRRFHVSPQSNRMGYRLTGETPALPSASEQISFGVPSGAVQLPPRGEPILLMMDHATTGGYEVVATVIAADLPIAGQLAPGDWIEFERVTLEEADAALAGREAAFG